MQLRGKSFYLALNQASSNGLLDAYTSQPFTLPRGNAARFICALFNGDPKNSASYIDDLGNIVSATLCLRKSSASGDLLFQHTLAAAEFDNPACTYAAWAARSDRQFSFLLPSSATNWPLDWMPAGSVYFAVQIITTGEGPITVATGKMTVVEEGIGGGDDTVIDHPTYMTTDEVLAAIAARAGGSTRAQVKSADFPMVAFVPYAIDTTAGGVVATLPAAPTIGDIFPAIDAMGTWNTHGVTFERNGNLIEGVAADYVDIAQGTSLFLEFVGGTKGYRICESGTKPHILVAPTAPSGTAQVGSVATADNGTWTGSPTSYSYQWWNSVDGGTTKVNISGATSLTYTYQSSDSGLVVGVDVTAANSNGNSLPVSSAATAVVTAPTFPSGAADYYAFAEDFSDSAPAANTLVENNSGLTFESALGGSAVVGDGASWLEMPVSLNLSGDFTINLWALVGPGSGASFQIFCGYPGSGLSIAADPSNAYYGLSTVANYIAQSYSWDSNFHMVTLRRVSGVVDLLIDAALIASHSGDTTDYTDTYSFLAQGSGGNAYANVGSAITRAGIWASRGLSDGEIALLFNGGTPPAYAP